MIKISDTLNYVFNNKKFLEEILNLDADFSMNKVNEALANTLFYYLLTKDNNIKLSYKQILSEVEYWKEQTIPVAGLRRAMFQSSYYTHSFNGYEKELIQKYGFVFLKKCTDSERLEMNRLYQALIYLEQTIKRSAFIKPSSKNKMFLTLAGTKTFHYLLDQCPDRLYYGPFYQSYLSSEPIIVGESKSTYYEKIVLENALSKYPDDTKMQEKITEKTKIVTSAFCSCDPCFALIPLREIDIKIDEKLENAQKYSDFFTWMLGEYIDSLSDISVDKEKMYHVSNFDIVQMPCLYKLKQLYATMHKYSEGQVLYYHSCNPLKATNPLQKRKNLIK